MGGCRTGAAQGCVHTARPRPRTSPQTCLAPRWERLRQQTMGPTAVGCGSLTRPFRAPHSGVHLFETHMFSASAGQDADPPQVGPVEPAQTASSALAVESYVSKPAEQAVLLPHTQDRVFACGRYVSTPHLAYDRPT